MYYCLSPDFSIHEISNQRKLGLKIFNWVVLCLFLLWTCSRYFYFFRTTNFYETWKMNVCMGQTYPFYLKISLYPPSVSRLNLLNPISKQIMNKLGRNDKVISYWSTIFQLPWLYNLLRDKEFGKQRNWKITLSEDTYWSSHFYLSIIIASHDNPTSAKVL